MKIETEFAPKLARVSIQEFANRHGLTMRIVERSHLPKNDPQKFYASFKNCEVKRGIFLASLSGGGINPKAAMRDYCNVISGKVLAVDAWGEGRRLIQVPDLYFGTPTRKGSK